MEEKKMGAPRKEVDWEQFESLCQILATEEEIAAFFKMSIETLNTRCKEKYECTFLEVYKTESSGGKISLRRKMFQGALAGSIPMQIFLSKQVLDMSDNGKNGNQPQNITINYTNPDE